MRIAIDDITVSYSDEGKIGAPIVKPINSYTCNIMGYPVRKNGNIEYLYE